MLGGQSGQQWGLGLTHQTAVVRSLACALLEPRFQRAVSAKPDVRMAWGFVRRSRRKLPYLIVWLRSEMGSGLHVRMCEPEADRHKRCPGALARIFAVGSSLLRSSSKPSQPAAPDSLPTLTTTLPRTYPASR